LSYTWWAERRGFVRNTLNAGSCDLVPGTTNGIEMLRTTRPYYRSGFAFVMRPDGPQVSSLDDPVLRKLKIGIQLVGEDGSNPPPAEALARRGLIDNVRGYSVYGDYRDETPAAGIVDAVANGDIDVAVVWGPVAGYFASRERVPLRVTLVTPQNDGPRLPMVFDINMGVRKDDPNLRDEINAALAKLQPQIDAVLASYGVPRADLPVDVQSAGR
jgi:mxaJ protein